MMDEYFRCEELEKVQIKKNIIILESSLGK